METFSIDWGLHALLRLLSNHEFKEVLDVGSGDGEHKRFLEFFGKKVYSVDYAKSADYQGDFLKVDFDRKFDAIWCSHVLEHQRNVGLFLDKIFDLLKDGGILALVVPIHPRGRLIAGHLTSWSVPLACYNLIMAGFDCRAAEILSTYELAVLVRKKLADHKERRNSCAIGDSINGDLGEAKKYFPFEADQGTEVEEGMFSVNWDNPLDYSLPRCGSFRINCKNTDAIKSLTPRFHYQAKRA